MTNPFFINQNFGSMYGRRIHDAPPYPTFIPPRPEGFRTWQEKLRDQQRGSGQRIVQEIPKSAVDCGWILVDHIVFTTAELDALIETQSLEALLREALSLRLAWRFTGRDSFTEERELHFKTPVPSITTL